jgi:FixJ family two-component response regulator
VGYHALTFASAEEFLEFTPVPGEGCLVLDIHLPKMTGLDLQEKLTSSGAKYSVIIITAHDNPQYRERAEKAGVIAYLSKPFSEQALLEAVDRCRRPGKDLLHAAAGGNGIPRSVRSGAA